MEELASFLTPASRLDVKMLALQQVLGLSATPSGLSALSCPAVLAGLTSLISDPVEPVASEACRVLINLSAAPTSCSAILGTAGRPVVPTLLRLMQEKRGLKSQLAEKASMLLSNLTREAAPARTAHAQMSAAGQGAAALVALLCQEGEGALPYLGPTLSNLSQLPAVRAELLSEGAALVRRLLPFTEYQASTTARGGVVGCLRNCCFAPSAHALLLGPGVGLLPHLLLPLAGPTPEDLTEEEVEGLPLDLQYLPDDKKVEEDLDIRTMLLEALTQLCATRAGREQLRRENVYLVLRQFHLQEEDTGVRLAAESLVDILIKTEEEIKIDNYKDVEVPKDMVPEFNKMDEAYLTS